MEIKPMYKLKPNSLKQTVRTCSNKVFLQDYLQTILQMNLLMESTKTSNSYQFLSRAKSLLDTVRRQTPREIKKRLSVYLTPKARPSLQKKRKKVQVSQVKRVQLPIIGTERISGQVRMKLAEKGWF